jgi:hypothetical protein
MPKHVKNVCRAMLMEQLDPVQQPAQSVATAPATSRHYPTLRLFAGFGLLISGGVLALPGVPGPGILLMVAGLALLGDRFAWARRALAWLRCRARQMGDTARRCCPEAEGQYMAGVSLPEFSVVLLVQSW